MATSEPDDQKQLQAAVEYKDAPAWASTYAEAALRCGQNVAEIETSLVSKGLSPGQATFAVDRCFKLRLGAEQRASQRAVWLKRLSRGLSLAIACVCIAAVAATGNVKQVFRVAVGFLTPVAFIWFSDEFGRYVGPAGLGYVIRPTPGIFLAIGGWFLLLGVPLLVILIVWLN